jgi:hypothetical protein
MKKIFSLLIVAIGFLSFGQNQTKNYSFQSASISNFKPIVVNYIKPNNKILTLYSPITRLTETYYFLGKPYELGAFDSKKMIRNENSIKNSFATISKKFSEALVFGALNLLIDRL